MLPSEIMLRGAAVSNPNLIVITFTCPTPAVSVLELDPYPQQVYLMINDIFSLGDQDPDCAKAERA